jgi:hypothetical protein
MTDPTVQGSTEFTLRHRYTARDIARGVVTTEVWNGLYSSHEEKALDLWAAGAVSVTPSMGGSVCTITAIFGGTQGSQGGGSGGGGTPVSIEPITVSWSDDPHVSEVDLKGIRTWGLDGNPLSADNKERARILNLIDKYISSGQLDLVSALTDITDNQKKYGIIKASGINGAYRSTYAVTKTTTWARFKDAKGYVDYSKQLKVISWAEVGAPSDYDEPLYRDIDINGTWVTSHCEWLTMPPRKGLQGRVFTVIETWLGAYKWKAELYDGGTG